MSDYRRLILDLLAGSAAPRSSGSVFQFIGKLDRPSQIGLVEPGGRWTIYDLNTGDVRFVPGGPPLSYAALPANSLDKTRADRLIRRWEVERWRHHAGR